MKRFQFAVPFPTTLAFWRVDAQTMGRDRRHDPYLTYVPGRPHVQKSVEDHVLAVEGVKTATVDITFSPPWDPVTMASDDVKAALGIW